MAYKATCSIKDCAYEKVDDDFDKLVDSLQLHYSRIHKITRVKKWSDAWEIVATAKKKAVK